MRDDIERLAMKAAVSVTDDNKVQVKISDTDGDDVAYAEFVPEVAKRLAGRIIRAAIEAEGGKPVKNGYLVTMVV